MCMQLSKMQHRDGTIHTTMQGLAAILRGTHEIMLFTHNSHHIKLLCKIGAAM